MNMLKQTCLFVANTSLHATAEHNGNAWKLVGMFVRITFSVLYESSTNAQKKVLSALWNRMIRIVFPTSFLNPHLHRLGWLCVAWKWGQCNSDTAAREHKTLQAYVNNQHTADSLSLDNWVFGSILFLTSDYYVKRTNLRLYSIDNQQKI